MNAESCVLAEGNFLAQALNLLRRYNWSDFALNISEREGLLLLVICRLAWLLPREAAGRVVGSVAGDPGGFAGAD